MEAAKFPLGGGVDVAEGPSEAGLPDGETPPAGVVGLSAVGVVGLTAPIEGMGETAGAVVDGPVTVTASFWLAPQCPVIVQMK